MTWLDELANLTVVEATEADDGIALITLNRPDHLNAITSTMITELEQVVAAVNADPVLWQTVDAPSLRHALDIENRTQIMCSANGDVDEARAAFVEKRLPEWNSL